MEKRDIIVIALPIEKAQGMGYDLYELEKLSMSEMATLANDMEIKSERENKESKEQDEPKAFLTDLANFEKDFNADDNFITSLTDYFVFYFTEQYSIR